MTLSSAWGGGAPTAVLTSDDVLFSSFFSAIVLSGSTDAVLVMVLAVGGEVALIVIDPFAPAFTRPPSQVTVIVAGGCGSAGSSSVQENRLVVEYADIRQSRRQRVDNLDVGRIGGAEVIDDQCVDHRAADGNRRRARLVDDEIRELGAAAAAGDQCGRRRGTGEILGGLVEGDSRGVVEGGAAGGGHDAANRDDPGPAPLDGAGAAVHQVHGLGAAAARTRQHELRRHADAPDAVQLVGEHDVVDFCAAGVAGGDRVGDFRARRHRVGRIDVRQRDRAARIRKDNRDCREDAGETGRERDPVETPLTASTCLK